MKFISYAGRKFPPDFFPFIFLPLLPVPYSATVTLNMLYTVRDTGSVRLEGSCTVFLCLGKRVEFEVLI
jgi:hypothetical protein